jgi:alkylation response protein AidB-like acyl-CoA dehydrogenase
VQTTLAELTARTRFLEMLNWKVAWSGTQGSLNPADASAVKVLGSELYIEAYRRLMEVVGSNSILRTDLEKWMRSTLVLTFGGGTNEIQRDIIATVGLGMPRAPR